MTVAPCNKLEQLEFKLEKNIGIQKHAGKVRKVFNFIIVNFVNIFLYFQGVQFYLKYGEDLFEVIHSLKPLEGPYFWTISICCLSAIISGFGYFSALLKLKSITVPAMLVPATLYFQFAVSNTKLFKNLGLYSNMISIPGCLLLV